MQLDAIVRCLQGKRDAEALVSLRSEAPSSNRAVTGSSVAMRRGSDPPATAADERRRAAGAALSTLRRIRIDGPQYAYALTAFAALQLTQVSEVEIPSPLGTLYEWVEAAASLSTSLFVRLHLSSSLRAELDRGAEGLTLRLFDTSDAMTPATMKRRLGAIAKCCSGRQTDTDLLPAIEIDPRWADDEKTKQWLLRIVRRISPVLVPAGSTQLELRPRSCVQPP